MQLNDTRPRERRRPGAGTLTWRAASGDAAPAAWLNLSRTGAAIGLGREVRRGQWLTLAFTSPLWDGEEHRLGARVAWCREDGAGGYVAGLRVRRDAPEAVLAFASLGREEALNRDRGCGVETTRWSSLAAREPSGTTTAA